MVLATIWEQSHNNDEEEERCDNTVVLSCDENDQARVAPHNPTLVPMPTTPSSPQSLPMTFSSLSPPPIKRRRLLISPSDTTANDDNNYYDKTTTMIMQKNPTQTSAIRMDSSSIASPPPEFLFLPVLLNDDKNSVIQQQNPHLPPNIFLKPRQRQWPEFGIDNPQSGE